ncbi:MAG: hypothetical protein EXS16_16670 [Gemmataceae bacterium]|nr:hypothetical protein [Gemmataceae bacterium]
MKSQALIVSNDVDLPSGIRYKAPSVSKCSPTWLIEMVRKWHALWADRVRSSIVGLLFLATTSALRAQDAWPADLPRYDIAIVLNAAKRLATVKQIVYWTNSTKQSTQELIFNAHSHYQVPEKDIGFLAKTGEILRLAPRESLLLGGPALQMTSVHRFSDGKVDDAVDFDFTPSNATALRVALPKPVAPGESVAVELNFNFNIPARKGRWGQWDGITTLAQWLPVLAVIDDTGWQPTPFIAWHQPFHNEAGVYRVKIRVPRDQVLAASSSVKSETIADDGWKEIEYEPTCVRDFSLVASSRFQEWTDETAGVHIRCVALPEHEFHAKNLVAAAKQALPSYNQWFGKYPYRQFTIAESHIGWMGNECGAMVLIDERVLNMPHIAKGYPVYLLQHELCHQWWYNVVGAHGYSETWMDEGLATYFSHRLSDRTLGRNNEILEYPKGLRWMPNIRRDDLRNYSMLGVRARGELHPTVQDLPKFGHLVNLTAATYDRGSKIIGMIEERMGESAFLDFMRGVYAKYQFRILRVANFQRELEAYTRTSWDEFFRHWVHGTGSCDWAVERVEINKLPVILARLGSSRWSDVPMRMTVYLKQQGDFNEPTTLGIRLQAGKDYQLRIPIHPDVPMMQLDEMQVKVECTQDFSGGKQKARVKVELYLHDELLQISVDPDNVLLDTTPTNNYWKREIHWQLTPLYTQLDEMDVTNAHDRWNVIAGPWLYGSSYQNPWYSKTLTAGLRLGVYRTQEVMAAGYLAYRANDRNIVAGADVYWDHVLLPHLQIGLSLERSIRTISDTDIPSSRGALYARYIFVHGSSLYLPPFEYIEAFGVAQNRSLPDPITRSPGADLFRERPVLGVHYHKNLLTPYWDAEGGFAFDASYQFGLPIFGNQREFHQVNGQFSFLKGMHAVRDWLGDGPIRSWLGETRWAFRVAGAAALPEDGQFFALGGGENFRGFALSDRQGSLLWQASVEWRLPVMTNLRADFLDHTAGVRNIYFAPFYDLGNAYLHGKQLGDTAHAVGAGLRIDVAWLGFIERTMLRFDVAKTVNVDRPVQFWFGIQHPF